MTDDAVTELVRWAATTTHRATPGGTRYQLTADDDHRAWLDRLSAGIARDRDETRRATRKTRRTAA